MVSMSWEEDSEETMCSNRKSLSDKNAPQLTFLFQPCEVSEQRTQLCQAKTSDS